MVTILTLGLEELLDFVVQYEHERTTGTSEDVRECALEEGGSTLSLSDRRPAVYGVLVKHVALGTAGLHHHAPTDRVEWIRDDTGYCGHGLSDGPADDDGCVLGVGQHTARRIVETEICSTVDNDTLYGYTETSVQTDESIRLEDLADAVTETGELALAIALTDVSGETSTGEVERVYETERGGTGGTARREITSEVAPELRILVYAAKEHLLVLVLESEVERLSREVPDHVSEVTTPEGEQALLLGNADEGVDYTLVALVLCDLFADVLHLEQQFDTLDGCYGGLGDGGRDTASQEVLGERDRIGEIRHFVRLCDPLRVDTRGRGRTRAHTDWKNHETRTPDF